MSLEEKRHRHTRKRESVAMVVEMGTMSHQPRDGRAADGEENLEEAKKGQRQHDPVDILILDFSHQK